MPRKTGSEYPSCIDCRAAMRKQLQKALASGPLDEIALARACCYDPTDTFGDRKAIRRILKSVARKAGEVTKHIWIWEAIVIVLLCCCGDTNGIVGRKCDGQEVCASLLDGAYCNGNGFCTLKCDRNKDCPDDAACVRLSSQSNCLPRCSTSSDCPMGTSWEYPVICTLKGGERVCY